ncbi:hypothetical protein P3X46_030025 [Hevea brasiliensis]|uniref:Exostosin GT47 domain-containing protein n=1 Tax=Hevea brasiliensis TaxID=3981 RepID=A0ABQ9KU47_HEVBR|nr:xyloglucan-specific galacturonosyltransferase 1-like [Hevea brasiliensis]KAJ9147911.1 hypothetical protein P3X46_030025 [Hevea brasiliensis]
MAISMSKKKCRLPRNPKEERKELCLCDAIWFQILSRIPALAVLLILIFLWSSSTTIISGNIVHVCISSRKLSINLYCLSAGTQPNFEIPIPSIDNSSTSARTSEIIEGIDVSSSINGSVREVAQVGSPITNNITDVANISEDPNLIVKDRNEEVENAKKIVEEQLQLHRSWTSNGNPAVCDERGIYVYDLPSKFNKDLVGQCGDMIPWIDFCNYFDNEALGRPIEKLGKGWYDTHQYSLEPIFHQRILKHPCRVYSENEAKLFYVPYYGGLDILRWHFKNVSTDVKDILALELMKWLESRKPWVQNSGKDHVFVLGKISWDFRRNIDSSWGSRFLQLEKMQNPIKLLIERQPWEVNDIGIPHPTYFHPHSDDDIVAWQLKIIQATRKSLVSFAGAARPDQPKSIRSTLINQCTSAGDKCQFLNCSSGGCDQPETITELFVESEFCLQPPGDSPTRKSVFDSLVSGCIPVIFDPFTAYYQYPWHLPEDHGKYSVFIDQEEVRKMKMNVVERLVNITLKEREDMRRYIAYELLPGLVYADSSSQLEKFQDAFSITMNNLLERVNRLR